MTTIRDEWAAFSREVLPTNASRVQRQEMRRAFYAGCRSMLTLISGISDSAPTEDAGAVQIEALSQELNAFNEDMKGGRA